MSVILDALKKLDREKSYHRNGRSNLVVDILKPDLPHPAKSIRVYFSIVALTVIITLAVAYAVMVKFGFPLRLSPSKPVNSISFHQETKPVPLEARLQTESSPASVSHPDQNQQVVPAAVSREPTRIQGKEDQVHPKIEAPSEVKTSAETKALVETKPAAETKTQAEIKAPVETKPKAEAKPLIEAKPAAEIKTAVTPLDEKKAVMPEKGEVHGGARKAIETAPNVPPAGPPSLKLSAIVWYENPSMRFAMINGVKAIEGSEIEGVKVVEIKPSSVRFLENGRYFEISMTLK